MLRVGAMGDKDDDPDKGMGTTGEIRRREEFAKEAARKEAERQRELERLREAERRRRESDK
jgi:hypothetical protein